MSRNYYAAEVQVYNEKFYLNTESGEGIAEVLKKLEALINRFASNTYFPNCNFEDVKSELYILAMEGIYAFEPDRGVKLSTFMQTHLHNKIISKIKSQNKISNDASIFKKLDGADKLRRINEEISFSQYQVLNNDDDSKDFSFESSFSNENGLYSDGVSDYEIIDFKSSLLKISSELEPVTQKLLELIYFEDLSIQDAAREIGITGWLASLKLKKLASRGKFKNIFNQSDLNE